MGYLVSLTLTLGLLVGGPPSYAQVYCAPQSAALLVDASLSMQQSHISLGGTTASSLAAIANNGFAKVLEDLPIEGTKRNIVVSAAAWAGDSFFRPIMPWQSATNVVALQEGSRAIRALVADKTGTAPVYALLQASKLFGAAPSYQTHISRVAVLVSDGYETNWPEPFTPDYALRALINQGIEVLTFIVDSENRYESEPPEYRQVRNPPDDRTISHYTEISTHGKTFFVSTSEDLAKDIIKRLDELACSSS